MRHAVTEFVGILFGDDLWAPDAVSVLEREVGAHPEADFFHSARRVIDDAGRPISSVHPARHDVTLSDFDRRAPVKHLLCWRRTLGLEVGGMDEASRSVGPDDLDFPWTMAEHGATFRAIDECLYVYRDHRTHERLTTHLPRTVHVAELARIFRKHGLSRVRSRRRIWDARRGYLRQCLYRSEVHRLIRQRFGGRPRSGWRLTYR